MRSILLAVLVGFFGLCIMAEGGELADGVILKNGDGMLTEVEEELGGQAIRKLA